LKRIIPRLEELGEHEISYYLAVARAFGRARDRYIPGGKTRTTVHFISAGDRDREIANRGDWNHFCEKPVTFHKVAGDHFSILEAPNVAFLADIITALLPGGAV
jgi:thioesterase domain-containing protein